MAFAFFRRRQKMVVVIMAALMVSFLVGMQGFKMITDWLGQGDSDFATTRVGTITHNDRRTANTDVQLISPYALYYVRDVNSILSNPFPGEMEFLTLKATSDDPALLYALLLKEAQASDIVVTDADVENHYKLVGWPIGSEQHENLITQMQTNVRLGSSRLHSAVKRWLKVHKSYMANMSNTPPSEPEILKTYRDLSEKIDLRIVELPAEDFVDDVAEPGDAEIAEYFKKYKAIAQGTVTGPEDFGFGYSQPDRSRVQYLLLKGDVMLRVTRPSGDQLRKYFIANRAEFFSMVPIEPAADDQPTTAPATIEYKKVPKSFAQAKSEIIIKLQGKAIDDKVKDVFARARALMEGFKPDDALASPYEWVVAKMTHPADAYLDRKIEAVRIQAESLDSAMEILAEAAGLNAICYPYGKTADSELDPNVEITLSETDITLGDALGKIGKQIEWDDIEWSTCDGFDGVIFPSAATGMFPLAAGDSGLIDATEMAADEILSASRAANRNPLMKLAFPTRSGESGPGLSLVKVGEAGSQMTVFGPKRGVLIWRQAAAEAAHEPDELTDDIRQDVIRDIKIVKALTLAEKRAEELIAAAGTDGLEAAAKDADLESTTTGLFARRTMISPTQMLMRLIQSGYYDPAELFVQILKISPVELNPSRVSGVELAASDPSAGLAEAFMAKAFSLVPQKVEPAQGDDPYPDKPYAMISVKLPGSGTVLVLQREDYRPPIISDFQQRGRQMIVQVLSIAASSSDRRNWFDLEQAKTRLDFQPIKNTEKEDE